MFLKIIKVPQWKAASGERPQSLGFVDFGKREWGRAGGFGCGQEVPSGSLSGPRKGEDSFHSWVISPVTQSALTSSPAIAQ